MAIVSTDQNHVAESSALPDYAGPRAVANLKEILMEDKGDLAKSVHRIMLVDDEPDVLLTYKFFLAKQGYNVEAFPDAKSALANIKSVGSSHYDLVITDIRMQSLNGLQLYHRIRSIDPGLKVIFVSALDAIEELVSVLPGVTGRDIIRKPVNEQEFVKTVKDALLRARPAGSRLVSTIRK